jgi:hypothetical protein
MSLWPLKVVDDCRSPLHSVMPGLVPGIHVCWNSERLRRGGWPVEPGHDERQK